MSAEKCERCGMELKYHGETCTVGGSEAEHSFAGPAGSALVCGNCGHWEPITNPATVYVGWFPVFGKEAVSQHGDRCTAHSGLRSPNAELSDGTTKF
jgi:hypothetical protein